MEVAALQYLMDLVDSPDRAGAKAAKARLEKKKRAMMRGAVASDADLIATTVGQATAAAAKQTRGFGR